MKLHKHIYLPHLVLFVLGASGCTSDFFDKTIELDDTSYEKKIVLNSFVHQKDTALLVSVTQNFGLTETVNDEDYYLPNATLSWTDGAGVTTTDFYHTNRDRHEKVNFPTLQPGQTYTIKVAAAGFTPVQVQQTMPSVIQIDTILYAADGGVSQFGDDLSRVEVVFQDPPNVENFYALSVVVIQQYEVPIYDPNTGTILGYDTLSYENTTYAEVPLDPSAEEGIDNEIILNDELFAGETYRLRYSFPNYTSGGSLPSQVKVRFRHITRDEYLYRITEAKRQASEDFPLVEPVIVHSNVQDGIGIFGLSWSKSVVVEE